MPNPIPMHAKGYAVGYGKPPQSSRFKPGQSGNPKGRPRQKQRISDFEEELGPVLAAVARVMEKKVQFKRRGKVQQTTGLDTIMHTLLEQAIDGDVRASRMLLALMERAEEKARKREGASSLAFELATKLIGIMQNAKRLGLWDEEDLGETAEITKTEAEESETPAPARPQCALPNDHEGFDLVGVLGRKEQAYERNELDGDHSYSEKGSGCATAPQLKRSENPVITSTSRQGAAASVQPPAKPIIWDPTRSQRPRRPDEPLIRDERPIVSGHGYGTYRKD